ncbi:MAG: FGGY family carbohydrate kinase [Candidatus Neomarinimicrobiota bacterium]
MNKPAVLVIDQGTSATKGFIFDRQLRHIYGEKIRHKTVRPRPGWAETDAREILIACRTLLRSLLEVCRRDSLSPQGAGMAFQRSTFLFWERKSGDPSIPAISWQDSRARELTARFRNDGDWIQRITGIPLAAHFGGPKFLFCVEHDPELKSGIEGGDLLFGTVSAFVTHQLTGNAVLDESIAGRTLFLDLEKMEWNSRLLDMFGISRDSLPQLVPTCGHHGTIKLDSDSIPLFCVMGDQQAAMVGQGRSDIGDVAMNFGTSGSVLVNLGDHSTSVPSLLCNVLYSFEEERKYLLEGTINGVGSLFRWLEAHLDIPHRKMKWDERCTGATQGIVVPGINGISAPYWTGEFDTALMGFTESTHPNELVRAAMESIGFLVCDIWEILQEKLGDGLRDIVVSGGSSRSVLLQFIADILNRPLWNSEGMDMTALGVAKLVARQIWDGQIDDLSDRRMKKFEPGMDDEIRSQKINGWHDALRQLGIRDEQIKQTRG